MIHISKNGFLILRSTFKFRSISLLPDLAKKETSRHITSLVPKGLIMNKIIISSPCGNYSILLLSTNLVPTAGNFFHSTENSWIMACRGQRWQWACIQGTHSWLCSRVSAILESEKDQTIVKSWELHISENLLQVFFQVSSL